MRQIVLDTETTGLEWKKGNRVVEIGCVELLERRPLGVEHERAPLLEPGRNVVLVHVLLLVAGNEVGSIDQIGGL